MAATRYKSVRKTEPFSEMNNVSMDFKTAPFKTGKEEDSSMKSGFFDESGTSGTSSSDTFKENITPQREKLKHPFSTIEAMLHKKQKVRPHYFAVKHRCFAEREKQKAV